MFHNQHIILPNKYQTNMALIIIPSNHTLTHAVVVKNWRLRYPGVVEEHPSLTNLPLSLTLICHRQWMEYCTSTTPHLKLFNVKYILTNCILILSHQVSHKPSSLNCSPISTTRTIPFIASQQKCFRFEPWVVIQQKRIADSTVGVFSH